MREQELINTLGSYGYPVLSISRADAVEILNDLADSKDPRLLEGFPVVVAYCSHKNQKLNVQRLLSMPEENSLKRKKIEKLLLVSYELLLKENLKQPLDLADISKSLKTKYGTLLSTDEIDLSGDVSLSTERLRNTFKRYTSNFKKNGAKIDVAKYRQKRSFQLHLHLSKLFSPKQKEIVLKKNNGQPLTKTEQEYFSRTIKKKLEALANNELTKLAKKLIKK